MLKKEIKRYGELLAQSVPCLQICLHGKMRMGENERGLIVQKKMNKL
jgi:hypothetical protein